MAGPDWHKRGSSRAKRSEDPGPTAPARGYGSRLCASLRPGRPALDRTSIQMDEWRKVLPFRITLLDQLDLPLPAPTLHPFLGRDRLQRIIEGFGIDEAKHLLLPDESRAPALAVLDDALSQAVGDADVQSAAALARHDVDAVGHGSSPSHHGGHPGRSEAKTRDPPPRAGAMGPALRCAPAGTTRVESENLTPPCPRLPS